MKPQEIIQASEMYNRIMEALKECEKVNKASNYNGDLLWVMCRFPPEMLTGDLP